MTHGSYHVSTRPLGRPVIHYPAERNRGYVYYTFSLGVPLILDTAIISSNNNN